MFSRLKSLLKKNKLIVKMYDSYKQRNIEKRLKGKYTFESRVNGRENLCIVLAGYKEFCKADVLGRIKKFAEPDIDICVVTSGKYIEDYSNMCRENGWSYLSTKRNNVCLAQNIAISLFPEAKFIYKLDEDIFITKDFFVKLKNTYLKATDEEYYVGFVAPLIPINGYGYVRILEKLNLADDYASRFGEVKYTTGSAYPIEGDENAAIYMWGGTSCVPSIDEINASFGDGTEYSVIPLRFSIGAILFTRDIWKDMGYFEVAKSGPGMGGDEAQFCRYCVFKAKVMIACENSCVGHLSFGKQNEAMKQFYLANPEKFAIPNS